MRGILAPVLVGCALMFAVIETGPTLLSPRLDRSNGAIVASTAMLVLGLVLQRLFYKRDPLPALDAVGFRTPTVGAVAVALILSIGMLAFFPVFAAVTGASIRLRSDWLWLLAGAIALNGIAEETLFRGYVFGGLRRGGYSFVRAGMIALAIFAAVHLLIFLQNEFIIGLLATMVALAIAFPLAFLFERGNNAIWPPALVHVATHAIRMVEVSEPYATTAIMAWLAFQIAVPFSIFAFRGNLLR